MRRRHASLWRSQQGAKTNCARRLSGIESAVLYLDHEAFGIYGVIEPSYDLRRRGDGTCSQPRPNSAGTVQGGGAIDPCIANGRFRATKAGDSPQFIIRWGVAIGSLAMQGSIIARRLQEDEVDPAEHLGLAIVLHADIKIDEAVEIVAVVRDCGFKGATFAPKHDGEISIYHTDDLGMTTEQFHKSANLLVARLRGKYARMQYTVNPYLVLMPQL